jgi:glyoxylase-like metal-dependent hydrolase (beta-lactamase superfamily II)/rhodanese-related sulfurtransferase
MIIEQLYTGCLAEAAYYIASEGECAIIDPLRETEPYLRKAASNNTRIRYVFETHFHADFVSGHIDLASKSGADIVFGPGALTDYEKYEARDGEVFPLGKVFIKVLHTPGHTPESVCYLLLDEEKQPVAIFTGDTLFIGDVGRPDLAVKSDLSREDLAGMLYTSLRDKIMPLPDHVLVYPAHGAGSACGKNMSKETFDTLGHQKQVNYALHAGMTKEAFIREVTSGILPPPQYFPKNAAINRRGYTSFDEVASRGSCPMNAAQFAARMSNDILILDTRTPDEFAEGHIHGSLFIGLDGQFAPWVGALVESISQPILLVVSEGREREAIMRLARVGYDNVVGYLDGGIKTWADAGNPVESFVRISPFEFKQHLENGVPTILDVRKPGEYASEHIPSAVNLPLDFVEERWKEVPQSSTVYVHCAGGYRSVIFQSIMRSKGYKNLIDVSGGFNAITAEGIATSGYVCPSKNLNNVV